MSRLAGCLTVLAFALAILLIVYALNLGALGLN